MKYLFEVEPINPVSLEQELGLARGDVKEVIIYADGAVEIETANALSATNQTKVKEALAKRGLPRGRKPINS